MWEKGMTQYLPCREPRGSPQNTLRMYMMRHLQQGKSREEAEELARAKMRGEGLDGWDCLLRYGGGIQSQPGGVHDR
jgi:hypothetical protein